jgi:hypothetical protein
MAQIVHRPAVLNDQERNPLRIVPRDKYPYSEDQGQRFYDPKESVEDFFVTRLGLVVGDVPKKLPHGPFSP